MITDRAINLALLLAFILFAAVIPLLYGTFTALPAVAVVGLICWYGRKDHSR